MKFAQLAVLLSVLLSTYGEVKDCEATHFQEDCCGEGSLTAGVRLFHLVAARRDVLWLRPKAHYSSKGDSTLFNFGH